MKKVASWILLTVFLLSVACFWILPTMLLRSVTYLVETTCPPCTFKGVSAHFNLFENHYVLEDLLLEYKRPKVKIYRASIPTTVLNLNHLDLLFKTLRFESILLKNLKFEILEYDSTDYPRSEDSSAKGKSDDVASDLKFFLKNIEIVNGEFLYTHRRERGDSKLRIAKITGSLDRLTNIRTFVDEISKAQLAGQIEGSGKVDLELNTAAFKKPLSFAMSALVSRQELASVNSFFVPYSEIELFGKLLEGRVQLSYFNGQAQTSIRTQFENLKIQFINGPESSGFGVFVRNFVQSFVFKEENKSESIAEQVLSDYSFRKEAESLVPFVLRSLKEAAIATAK